MTRDSAAGRRPRRFKQMRFRQLRAFAELAEHGSFAATAKRLNIAVTSVWQQVRALEASLGAELVRAEGRSLALTPDGQRLLRLVSPLVRGFDELQRSFADRPPEPPTVLTLAASAAALEHDLAGTVASFEAMHADVDLRLIERDSATCLRMVEEGAADIAVAGTLDDAFPAALAARRLARHPFMFVSRPDHALARSPRLSLANLARQAFVVHAEGSSARGRLDEVFGRAGLRGGFHVAMEAAVDESLLEHVRKGYGIAIVPVSDSTAAAEAAAGPAGLVLRDVSRLFGHETISVFQRRFRCQTAYEKDLCDLLLVLAAAPPASGCSHKPARGHRHAPTRRGRIHE